MNPEKPTSNCEDEDIFQNSIQIQDTLINPTEQEENNGISYTIKFE